jgi:nucleotide-binding universal stress UspA family protein
MIEIRRILCPVDFSECSRRAADHAMAIARWYGASVTALHVYPMPPVAAAPADPIIFEPALLTAHQRTRLLAATRQFLAAATSGVGADAVLREGGAAAEILEQARDIDADLIVMGTHGRSGVDRLLLGSVTERVLRKAACPVLTVPHAAADTVPTAPVLYKSIVCPVDFSDASMRAMDYAFSLAREADAHLTVLHVTPRELDLPTDDGGGDVNLTVEEFFDRRERWARQRLEEAVGSKVDAYCTTEALVTRGRRPWQEILRVAGERQAALIVMGIQGRGAVDRMVF